MVLNLINVLSATVWVNMTVYDVLPEDCRHTISDKDVGEPPGDRLALCHSPQLVWGAYPIFFATW